MILIIDYMNCLGYLRLIMQNEIQLYRAKKESYIKYLITKIALKKVTFKMAKEAMSVSPGATETQEYNYLLLIMFLICWCAFSVMPDISIFFLFLILFTYKIIN
jgi:hypothetical protein